MATFTSYDMKGLKLSFANWISNISPTDTPFASMTGKESVDQTKFQWQVDRLAKAVENAVEEGSVAADGTLTATVEMENFTQILRKAVRVTQSVKQTGLYGRSNELSFQMEKAGQELKLDIESMLLTNPKGTIGSKLKPRVTSGFRFLVGEGEGAKGEGANAKMVGEGADPDTGAIVIKQTATPNVVTEKEIFDMTYNLYLAGSKANTIMLHPYWMRVFSSMTGAASGQNRERMFKNLDARFNLHVSKIKDPLGQEFVLIPNRCMPKTAMYFFNASDWTQMIFRAPERTQLSTTGSSEKWMIEMELGLRHRNPFASGVLMIRTQADASLKQSTISAWTNKQNDILDLAFIYGIDISAATTDAAIKTAVAAHFASTDGGGSGEDEGGVAPETVPAPVRKAKTKAA